MNASRMTALVDQQTGTARKVYESTPIAEPWTVDQITRELHRLGMLYPRSVVHGCCESLVRDGIVRKRGTDRDATFIRVPIVQSVPHPAADAEGAAPVPQPKSILDVFQNLSAALRKAADDIDSAALLAQDEIDRANARASGKGAKVRELLQELLSGDES